MKRRGFFAAAAALIASPALGSFPAPVEAVKPEPITPGIPSLTMQQAERMTSLQRIHWYNGFGYLPNTGE